MISGALPVFSEQGDVDSRLAELHLKQAWLVGAIERGHAAWASCTENHPPIFGGISAWAETVCALKDAIMPHNWTRSNEANLPLTINFDGTVAVTVATGDEETGRKDGAPCTSSAKGPRTAHAILENLGQALLFPAEMLPPAAVVNTKGRETWILLMYRDKRAREVRSELSRPISMAEEGHVNGWAERIILTPISFDDNNNLSCPGSPNGPQSPEIDVEIKKRG